MTEDIIGRLQEKLIKDKEFYSNARDDLMVQLTRDISPSNAISIFRKMYAIDGCVKYINILIESEILKLRKENNND